MLDVLHINDGSFNKRIFYANGGTSFQTWTKPRNAKFVHILCLGSGSGGGGAGCCTLPLIGGDGGSGVVLIRVRNFYSVSLSTSPGCN